jgi:hypothetical protein
MKTFRKIVCVIFLVALQSSFFLLHVASSTVENMDENVNTFEFGKNTTTCCAPAHKYPFQANAKCDSPRRHNAEIYTSPPHAKKFWSVFYYAISRK